MSANTNAPKFKYVNSESKFNEYVNHTGIAMSNFDITMLFGQINPQMGQEKPVGNQAQELTVTMLGSITMSPVHAKLVCANLQANIEQYEKLFGKIITPPAQAPTVVK